MLGFTKRPKRAAQRGNSHALTEVVRIVRISPVSYVAHVQYSYGRNVWDERVGFDLKLGKDAVTVVVTDSDFPADRALTLVIGRDVDMPTFITSFLIAGRW